MLIVFPLGLLATAVIVDIVYFVGGALIFAELSHYLIIAGLIGGGDGAHADAPSSLRHGTT
jgi:uncharacterized membrane protein